MQSIRNKFLYFSFSAVLSAAMTIFLFSISVQHAIVLMSILTMVFVVFACKALQSYQEARLICENPILNVGMASVARYDAKTAENAVNVVVSGFGILMDDKPYKFGHGGVRLIDAIIDRESIALSFGQDKRSYSVRLLHGISELSEIEKLKKRLQYETGVIAIVNGW